MEVSRTFRTAALIVVAGLAGGVIGRTLPIGAPDAPDNRDAWEKLRTEHHCKQMRTDMPSEDNTHGKSVWLCDGGEFFIRNVE